jgi:hypothetical protein
VADITFTPTFHHTEFVDDDGQVANPDRVRADEPNGFNKRFHDIETDLTRLSTVVGQVTAAINQLGTPSATLRLTLPPSLVAAGGHIPWTITATGSARTNPGAGAQGLLEVSVPPGLKFVSLRAVGTNGGAGLPAVVVSLSRAAIGSSAVGDEIARVSGNTAPFDLTTPATAAVAGPTGAQFRYIITASVDAVAGSGEAVLSMFQLVLARA